MWVNEGVRGCHNMADEGKGKGLLHQGSLFTSGRGHKGSYHSSRPELVHGPGSPRCTQEKEKICRAEEINCLVYTAHTDTHSYTNSHVHHHAWMPIAANTALPETHAQIMGVR